MTPDLPEVNVQVDGLVEAIRQWHKRINGKVLSDAEVLKEVNRIVKDRL